MHDHVLPCALSAPVVNAVITQERTTRRDETPETESRVPWKSSHSRQLTKSLPREESELVQTYILAVEGSRKSLDTEHSSNALAVIAITSHKRPEPSHCRTVCGVWRT